MLRVRRASSIAEKHELAARAQRRSRFFGKLLHALNQFIGKTLFDSGTLLELAANLFFVSGHAFQHRTIFSRWRTTWRCGYAHHRARMQTEFHRRLARHPRRTTNYSRVALFTFKTRM
jgi:hypothetical protein